jgi:hypothetical protein
MEDDEMDAQTTAIPTRRDDDPRPNPPTASAQLPFVPRRVDDRWDFYRERGTLLLREQAKRRDVAAEVFTRQVA